MTAHLNFEAESFNGFGSSSETQQDYEIVGAYRTGAPVHGHGPAASPAVRDHRSGATAGVFRNPRPGASVASVHGRQGFASHLLHGPASRGISAFPRRVSGFGAPGGVRGISGLFHGVPGRTSWNRSGYGGRPSSGARGWFGQGRSFGNRGVFGVGGRYGHDFQRRWPWLSRDWRQGLRDGGMGAGFGSTDGGYPGPGSSAPDFSGSGSAGPDYSAPDSSSPDSSGSGFAAGAAAPGPGSPSASDDPQTVGWAQGCLAQIVGGWVPQDGKPGRLTARAIGIFQTQAQIPSTGTLDDNTLIALQNACRALGAASTPGQATAQAPPPDASSAALPNVVAPDAAAGAPSAAPTGSGAPSATPPPGAPAADSSATTPAQQPELPYWSHEYQEYENGPQVRTCEPDRCTNAYLRWLQNSLNQVFGQRLAITGTLDDSTMAAINRFRLAKKLRVSESYHVGPAIEDALLAAGAAQPPAVPPTQCTASDPGKLIPILDQARGDIPLEFLLGWIDVESAWVLEPPSVTCERGYFQLYPEDSTILGLDHDRIGTDPAYSIQSGVPFVNHARKQIERAVKAFGVAPNSDLYWHLVKLWHWIPSAPEKILAAMSAHGVKATDWQSVRAFAHDNFDSLTKIIRRDPRDGIGGVDRMFARVNAWRKQLHR
jgi:hypothetical protein